VGGFVGGTANANITECYATGDVSGFNAVGGFIGVSGDGSMPYDRITNCFYGGFVAGAMSGTYDRGGICGSNNTAVYSGCYWDTEVGGTTNGCERTVDADPAGMQGMTNAQMMQQATFAGWDFTSVWDIKEGYTYPFFIWEQFDSPVVAQDDAFTIDEDSIVSSNVTLDNGFGPDVDPDGGPLTMIAMNGDGGAISVPAMIPSGAWVRLWQDGTFTYVPSTTHQALAPGQWALDTFNYTVRDVNGTTDTATVTVNVTGLNDMPTIINIDGVLAYTEGDGPSVMDGNLTLYDADDANLESAIVKITDNYQFGEDVLSIGSPGSLTIAWNAPLAELQMFGTATKAVYEAALESITYENTAENPSTLNRTVSWTVNDGTVNSNAVTSVITVAGVNDPPVAVNDTGAGFTVGEDAAFDTADVTLNDLDQDTDPLSVWALDATGAVGQVIDNGNNTFNYDPNGQYEYLGSGDTAHDFFNYTVSDGNGGTDVGMVTITITGANDAPALDPIGNRAVDEGTLLTFNATATDPEGDQLSFSLEPGSPAGASINGSSGEFAWTPAEGQGPGFYNITVRVTDDGSPNLFDNETITVAVGDVNQAPVLNPVGNRAVNELAALAFTASATDADIPAGGLTYSLGAGAPAGASINATTGAFSWTPTEAQGPNTYFVTIRVTDDGTPALDDFEVIQITVSEVNSAPVLAAIGDRVIPEMAAYAFTALTNDADLPANALMFSLDAGAPSGAAITATGVFTWTPTEAQGPGNHTVTVRVSDGIAEDFETFNIEVLEVNSAPLAADDAFTIDEDSGANTLAVRANDADADGDALLVMEVTQGSHGAVSITGGGTAVSYVPDDDYFGTDTFTYRVADAYGANDTATVTVTVAPRNDNPVATDDTLVMDEDGGIRTVDVLANDNIGPDAGEALSISEVTQGAHGTVATASNRVTYEPDDNYYGTDTFTYTITDGNGGESTATVTVLVTAVNDAPAITSADVAAAVQQDNYTVSYTATDIDGDTLAWSLVTDAGWLDIDPATGVLSGRTEPGTYSVRVTVADGNGGSDLRQFSLVVSMRDSDNDGVPDSSDEFPADANETVDTDGDGTGDTADADDDGDGVPDTTDGFPHDATETVDTDGDGLGDNADTDDDRDGVPDADDPEPLNAGVTGNEYEPEWPYWRVLVTIGLIALVGLLGLAVAWSVSRR
jgi:VCBS repeat-containing protein